MTVFPVQVINAIERLFWNACKKWAEEGAVG